MLLGNFMGGGGLALVGGSREQGQENMGARTSTVCDGV